MLKVERTDGCPDLSGASASADARSMSAMSACSYPRPELKLWREPLDIEKFTAPHGEMHILRARCKGCQLCVKYCPRDVLEMSDEMNEKGYYPPRAVHPEQCVACRLCELLCPEFCIYVVEVSDSE